MDPIEKYLAYLQSKGLSKHTVDSKDFAIRRFETYINSLELSLYTATEQTIVDYYRDSKESGLSESTCYKYSAVVYEFFQCLVDAGELLVNPAFRVKSHRGLKIPQHIPDHINIETICNRLYASGDTLDYRDALVIDLIYSGGLRKGEIQRLKCSDVDCENALVKVKGKGGHERVVPIGKECAQKVQHYIYNTRPKLLKDGCPSALFLSYKTGQRITIVGIGRMFDRINERYHLNPKLAPHSLRHACATDLLRNGAPIQDISKILGHVDIRTTEIYTRVTIEDLKEHYKQYHPRA